MYPGDLEHETNAQVTESPMQCPDLLAAPSALDLLMISQWVDQEPNPPIRFSLFLRLKMVLHIKQYELGKSNASETYMHVCMNAPICINMCYYQ